jgi:radical SAM protein with 4Fe4S-binding SPASM domain
MRTGPDYIQFYPTIRCNKACDFCFNRSMPGMDDMPIDAFESMLVKLKQASVKTLDIIGGEPLLHRDVLSIADKAAQQGFSINISSNGSNLDILGRIMDLGSQVSAGISINDHQTLAQAASFIRARKPVVKTLFTASPDSGLIQAILGLKPKKFYLIFRDVLDRRELPDAVSFHRYLTAVEKGFGPLGAGMVYCSGFLPDAENSVELATVRCPAGTTKLGVMPDGSMYPCNLFFGISEYLLGNILVDPFEKIWNNPLLAFFRTWSGNACTLSSCRLHGQCHGGCPAQSLIVTGDLAAPDPRCSEC